MSVYRISALANKALKKKMKNDRAKRLSREADPLSVMLFDRDKVELAASRLRVFKGYEHAPTRSAERALVRSRIAARRGRSFGDIRSDVVWRDVMNNEEVEHYFRKGW